MIYISRRKLRTIAWTSKRMPGTYRAGAELEDTYMDIRSRRCKWIAICISGSESFGRDFKELIFVKM